MGKAFHSFTVWYTVLDTSGDFDVDLTDTTEVFARSEREAREMGLRRIEKSNPQGYPAWIDEVALTPHQPYCTVHTLKRMG